VAQKIPNWFNQFLVFVTRDVLAKLDNKQYLFINIFAAPALALFIAFMVKYYNVLEGDAAYSFFNNHNIPVYFFMSVVVALFFGLTMSAEEIYRDRKILKREQFLNLSRSSYLVSKVCVLFTISAMQTFLFIMVGNAVLEIPLNELRYWVILFSSSCFANILGLNISSSFNSAVTIYIMIPLLIIPQLLLSGVVINFDKFNPRVGKPVGVPLVGEVMASRWAYEAFMVTQFKDNPFEKIFYDLEKVIAESEYKRVYLVPELESRLAYCVNNRSLWRNPNSEPMVRSLALLHDEITYELDFVGAERFKEVELLAVGKFDSTVYQRTARFLTVLKQYYTNKMTRADAEKQKLIDSLTNNEENTAKFELMRSRYMNKAVTDAVKNVTAPERIVEYDGKLVQKIYPIYEDEHRPAHRFDFSANLYQPTKHFLGFAFDTLYFNLAVIWSMALVLFVTLYFDVLRRFVTMLEMRRKYRKRDQH
jgi:hypothetical protein